MSNIFSHNDTTGVYILPDSCNYTYYPHVKVTNVKGCVAEAEFPFDVVDTTAPVVDASAIISDTTLVRQPGCKFFLPDLTQLFNNNNVSDNCYKVGSMTLTQDPVAGMEITENKAVKITLTDHCGNSSVFTINANLPSDNITITNIAVVDTAFCLNGTATLTAFIDTLCGGHCSVTAIDTLHLFVRENPVVQVSQKRIDNCFGEGLSKDQLAALASYATPDATGLSWKEIQWSTDGTTFDTVVPTPSTVVDTYYYCVGATATSVDENVTAAKDCKLIWSMSQTFDPVITGAALTGCLHRS